jgi:uncharacterized membrane protein
MSINQLSTSKIAMLCIASVLVVAFMLLGSTGAFVLLAMILFFVIPQYAILRALPIEEDERWFFSLFIGLGLFSTAVWFVGRFMPLKISLVATLILVAVVAVVLQKYKSRFTSASS